MYYRKTSSGFLKTLVSQVRASFVIAHTGNYDNHGKISFLYLTPAHNKTFKEAHIEKAVLILI